MSSNDAPNGPYTAVVLGSGCSRNLGVPTMVNFMDKVFDALSQSEKPQDLDGLKKITKFISRIKGSAAYIRSQLLNIEELYGLTEMEEDLGDEKLAGDVKKALNRAIFKIAFPAGREFLSKDSKKEWWKTYEVIEHIRRESHTEQPTHRNLGRRHTNLLAYLCLASHKDRHKTPPLFVQFNWDLALDRALYLIYNKDKEGILEKMKIMPWYDEASLANGFPRVVRPHGGLNWVDEGEGSNKLTGDITGFTNRCHRLGESVWFDPDLIRIVDHEDLKNLAGPPDTKDGSNMAIVPPTWRKHVEHQAYEKQWETLNRQLKTVRRIVFIGYSFPKTDLYLRHFLALALAANDHAPKVYVWNTSIFKVGPAQESFMDVFAPLASERRLYGIDGHFGDPGLLDLHQVLQEAQLISP